eukprot:gene20111-26835_t
MPQRPLSPDYQYLTEAQNIGSLQDGTCRSLREAVHVQYCSVVRITPGSVWLDVLLTTYKGDQQHNGERSTLEADLVTLAQEPGRAFPRTYFTKYGASAIGMEVIGVDGKPVAVQSKEDTGGSSTEGSSTGGPGASVPSEPGPSSGSSTGGPGASAPSVPGPSSGSNDTPAGWIAALVVFAILAAVALGVLVYIVYRKGQEKYLAERSLETAASIAGVRSQIRRAFAKDRLAKEDEVHQNADQVDEDCRVHQLLASHLTLPYAPQTPFLAARRSMTTNQRVTAYPQLGAYRSPLTCSPFVLTLMTDDYVYISLVLAPDLSSRAGR